MPAGTCYDKSDTSLNGCACRNPLYSRSALYRLIRVTVSRRGREQCVLLLDHLVDIQNKKPATLIA